MKKELKKSNSSAVKLFKFGATLAALAATVYFFLEPKGKKKESEAKAWAIKMKGDVIEKLELAKDVSEAAYHEIIDSVAAKYQKEVTSNSKEIRELAEDLKKHWKTISTSAKAAKNDVITVAKKIEKKPVAKKKMSKV